jgi:hypothetical protein
VAANQFDPFARHRQLKLKPKAQKPLPAQKLLDWLLYWGKPNVRLRDVLIYGPRSVRSRECAIDSTQILEKEGWLVPIKTRRRDMRQWEIVRKPIIRPTIATVATVAEL